MQLKWMDIREIAISLEENYPEIDNLNISFPSLRKLILDLSEFCDNSANSNERILEAIQMAWLEERNEE